jgi:hypothetical protein
MNRRSPIGCPGVVGSRVPQHPAYGIDFVHAVRLRRISLVAIATMALYTAVPIKLSHQARSEARSRWLVDRELLVPLTSHLSVTLSY